jgi:hypothetical protein
MRAALFLLVTACGRLGFDGGDSPIDAGNDAANPDGVADVCTPGAPATCPPGAVFCEDFETSTGTNFSNWDSLALFNWYVGGAADPATTLLANGAPCRGVNAAHGHAVGSGQVAFLHKTQTARPNPMYVRFWYRINGSSPTSDFEIMGLHDIPDSQFINIGVDRGSQKFGINVALSRHNLAWTLMRQGDLKYAIVMGQNATQRYPRELEAMSMLLTTEADLALFHALLGDIDAAEKGMARLGLRRHLTPNSAFPGMSTITRAVIDCRSGRAGDAARVLDENWAMCESSLTGDVVRVARVVRAFAIASADSRDAGKADLQLVNARPAYRGEYDFLGKAWPEMQTFLLTHDLATSSVHPS